MDRTKDRFLAAIAVVASAAAGLLFTSAASAAQYSMTGVWGANRGPLVDLPIIGAPCSQLKMGVQLTTMLPGATMTQLPVSNPGVTAFPGGCMPGSAPAVRPGGTIVQPVNVTGSSPAQFTVPPHAFTQPLPPGGTNTIINIVPTVVQLSTMIQFSAPRTTPFTAGGTMNPNGTMTSPPLAPWRVFRANAYQTQTGRAGPNFTWCAGNPACTVINQGGATEPMIVKYTAGPNAFGGTMGMLLNGGGSTSVIVGSTLGSPLIAHLPFGNAGTATMSQHLGRGYAAIGSAMLAAAPVHLGFGINSTMITTSGPVVNTIPGDTNRDFGFPWTEGTVLVRNTGPGPFGSPSNETLTAMGSDNRTPMGAGNITLVAGGVSDRVVSDQDFSSLDIMQIDFLPEPGAALQLGSAVLALVALAGWRRSRNAA